MLSNRKGFTLIELLIVVVIIGILAAIAIPKFSQARERAYWSALKSDLKSISSQEEIYYSKAFEYGADADIDFQESAGVTVAAPTLANNNQSWSATATHNALGGSVGCVIYNGQALATAPTAPGGATATQPGVPFCDE